MSDALQALIDAGLISSTSFPENSRYHGVPTTTMTLPTGETVVYLKRRLVPQPAAVASGGAHVVTQGERPDQIAARHLGDPELWWRLCDANGSIDPAELTDALGARIRIPSPGGAPRDDAGE